MLGIDIKTTTRLSFIEGLFTLCRTNTINCIDAFGFCLDRSAWTTQDPPSIKFFMANHADSSLLSHLSRCAHSSLRLKGSKTTVRHVGRKQEPFRHPWW